MTRSKHVVQVSVVKEFMENYLEAVQNEGSITMGELYGSGEKFTIFEDWDTVHLIQSILVIFSNNYHLYRKALDKADRTARYAWDHPKRFKYGGKIYRAIEDLRLGRKGCFPMNDEAMFLVPEAVQPYEEVMDELLGDWGFSDEYATCDNCQKILRTSPDSYGWTPDYVEFDDGRYCLDCTDVNEVLEKYCRKRVGIPWQIEEKAIKDEVIILMDHKWENGLHHGMNDDPKKIAIALKDIGIREWWWHLEPSQFYIDFQILLRPEDVKFLALWYDHNVEESDPAIYEITANKALEHIDAYQGYNQATEMQLALSGKHSDHIQMVSTTINMGDPVAAKAWVDGKIMDYARAKMGVESKQTVEDDEEE